MGSNRIKRPRNAQFRDYCFECADWVRDKERERTMMDVWGCVPEPQGRCDGRLVDPYRCACPLFRRRNDGRRNR